MGENGSDREMTQLPTRQVRNKTKAARIQICPRFFMFSSNFNYTWVLYSWLYACLIAAAFLLLSALLIHPVLNSVQLMAKVKPAQLLHTAFIDKGGSLEDFIMKCIWHLLSSSVVIYIRLFFMLHPHELLVLTSTHCTSKSSKAAGSLPL